MIEEVALRLNYRPNGLAQSLVSGTTGRVGFYTGHSRLDARNYFFAELIGGAMAGCSEVGVNLLIHTTGSSHKDLVHLVANRAIDGLVVHLRNEDPLLPVLRELKVPAISVADRVAGSGVPSVMVDDRSGGRLQAKLLAQLGHKKVLYRKSGGGYSSAAHRFESFLEASDALGIEVLCVERFSEDVELTPEEWEILNRPEGPKAVVAWEDGVARRIVSQLQDRGIRVPEDCVVIGFNGIPLEFPSKIELTTIRAPWYEVGRQAIRNVMRLAAGEPVAAETVLPVDLVRGSTA